MRVKRPVRKTSKFLISYNHQSVGGNQGSGYRVYKINTNQIYRRHFNHLVNTLLEEYDNVVIINIIKLG